MKRKASKQLSPRGEGEGGSTQVASLVIEIDPDGNLQMDFVDRTDDNGGQLRGLLVSKHTLRLSSPVFRTMLADDSPFYESRDKTTTKNGIQVIHFEDDDVASMEILMYALHLQNHRVPVALTITQLEELAIVCDKYDIRCLGPWAEMWSRPHLDKSCASHARALFVATVFRLADWFVLLTKDLILGTTLSSEGELLMADSSRFREGVPQSILDRIAERRTEVISQLLELCWQQSRKLRSAHGHCAVNGRPEHERQNCDLINLGSLSLQLPHLSGSPLDVIDLGSKNAISIVLSIEKLTPRSDTTTTDDHFATDHASCGIAGYVIFRATLLMSSVEGIELEPVAPGAPPQESTLLSQLSDFLERFHTRRLHTRRDTLPFEVVVRLTAIPNYTNFWREVAVPGQAILDTRFAWCPKLKCKYCPGFEYSLFQHQFSEPVIYTTLERHVKDTLHYERVKRIRRAIPRRTSLEVALAT